MVCIELIMLLQSYPYITLYISFFQSSMNIYLNPLYSSLYKHFMFYECLTDNGGGARGVMVIIVGNGRSETGSNPGRD